VIQSSSVIGIEEAASLMEKGKVLQRLEAGGLMLTKLEVEFGVVVLVQGTGDEFMLIQ
jgi:hypothetical protein